MTSDDRPTPALSLRERNRRGAMRSIQMAAFALVEGHGYDAVTIEDVAAAAAVSASSVYRYFGTKEAIFLWDEADAPVLAEVAARLVATPPPEALRHAIHELVDDRFARDRDGMLRRLRLIYAVPALEAAARTETERFRHALAAILAADAERGGRQLEIQVSAAAAVGALTVAIETWAAAGGERSFSEIVDAALDVLAAGLRQ